MGGNYKGGDHMPSYAMSGLCKTLFAMDELVAS